MSYTKDHLRAPLPAPLTADQAMLPTLSVETTRNLQTKVCRATIAIDSNTQHAVPAYCIVEASLALVLAKYENSAEICFDVGKAVGHESTTVEHTTHPFKIEIDQSDPIYRYLEKALDAIQCGTDTEGSSFSGIINPDVRDNRANRSRAILVAQSQYNEVQHDKTQSTYHSGPDRGNHQSCLQSVFVLHYLYLEFSLAHDQVDLRAHFDSADISIEKVQAILDVWQYILPQLSESGGERLISSIDFVPPAHKSTLSEWNPLILDESKAGVLDLISNHVSSRPNAPAVHSWDGLLSYAEIDLLSTRFAHHLLELSAGPGVFIAFCFDKSIWAIVSILAIIRSGAAFVAIDPKQPKSRIEILLRASRASIVLAEPSYAQLFDSLGMKVVKVDADFAEIFQDQIEQTRLPEVKSTDAVYIINTSGSTGMPKSIVVEHGQLSSSIPGLALASTLSSDSRVLQFSAYTFDACIHDILATLSYGGCVCVPSEHERLNDLAASIVRMQVNTALLTPSVLRLLYPWEVPCLKRLCAGGEAIPPDLLERWVGHVEFGNSYGPSECVVGCALKRNIHIGDDPNNIGTGIGAILWIVEPECHDHLCPIGCIGELMVEGPLLARGYTDPVLTKVAFIEDPSWAQVQCRPHRRFYKTGDLVKYNWDGTMSFIGRKDTQVKLAGRRIELGEIEHHVSRCEFVNEVIVQLPQHGIYKQQLVAVVTLGIFCESCTTSSQLELLDNTMMSAASTQIERIQDSLAELLPHYMIPRTWIVARTLPLSVTGKLDRASVKQFLVRQMLPIDSSEHGGARNNEKQPLSYNENRLAGIWATALDVDLWTINAQSNFFELGGNSLKAMYLVVQAQRQGIVVTVSEVFSKPVLAELATRLGAMDPLHAELERIQSMLEPFELVGGSIVARDIIGACSSICNLPWDIVEEVHPTTPLQAGLIALSTKNPGTYITHIIFELSSQIDVARFKNAWETCHSEVAILRSLILPSDRYGPCQVVLGTKLDWQRASSLEAFRTCNAKVPIVCGHLLNRFTLVQDDQYFVWSAHHSSYDATSIALILERVEQLYGKTDLPEPLSLVPLVKHIQSTSEASKIYWKSYLAKSEPVQFPRTQGDKGESLPDAMFKTKIPLIRKARSSITDSTMIRAAWALVISCYSGTDDVIFGATLSGRTAAVRGINNVFGPTITTVPVRIKLDYSESVISYLQRVQSESTMMMAFEHLGLQNISSLGHQYRRACDFQNLLVIQPPQTQRALDLLGLARIDTRPGDQQEAQTYPLNVEVELGNSSMGLRVSYNSHLITRVQIDRLTKQFSHVLQRLAIESHQSTVADFELISLQDLCQIQSWNARTPEPFFTSVPAQFLISVDRYPEAIAVTSWDRNFTYCELENASSKLARHLRATGVDIGTTVPVCLDKSAIAVVAILSILRAGGAYVALDPSHPFKRLASIIKGVNATIVVAAPEYTARFLDMSLEVLEFSSDLLDGLEATTSTLLPLVAPTSPAFIQFTSGSTGTPKGIIIEHQALCTSTNAFGSQWGVGHGTKVFQFAAFIFDVSVSDIFTSLMRGACVCMPSEYERMNDTAAAINRLGANYVSLTPGMASLLKPLDVPGLETLILGGEAPTQDNMRTWANKLNLIVCYGPAECSITCSGTEPATVDSEPADIGLPMGSTMWIVDPRNHNRLAPIGCIGEILVEGPILARGYLDDDEKTTASFVTNPSFTRYFGNGIPRRFYKTGDLGCYSSRSDGSMNFVGRKDTQVKLRGQRVELGEVEHHIYASSNVRHAVACVPSSGPFESRLIAVLVVDEENAGSNLSSSTKKRSKLQHTDDGDSDFQLSQIELCSRLSKKQILANISKIDDHLSGNVPRYMVPSTFIFVQRIPLNTSGKLNRQVVKAWLESADDETYQQITRYAEVEESELTLTVNEELVRRICGHVLRIDLSHVRMGQSFLGLGGDSIRAMLVVARTRSEGWIVTVKDILQSKSLSVLANLVVPIEETATAATTEPLKSSYGWVSTASTGVYFYDTAFRQRAINRLGLSNVDEIQAIYPCTPVQNGMLISHAQNSRLYEIKNIFEVKSTENGIVNANRLEEAWRCVVQRQPILRTIFFEEPSAYGIFHQIVVRRDQRPIHRLESSDEDPVEMLFTRNTINYHASTPPNQLTICTTRSARVFVKIDIIHALSDGTTWDLMFRELNAAYEGQLARSCPPQYEEYVSYLTLQPGVVALEYWKAYLTGTPPCNFSTFGGVEDAEPTPRSIGVAFEQSLSMRKVCSDNGITISNFMQAAWCLVLRSYMNRNQICFGYVVSGRDIPLPGIEDSMGTHIGQLPCRIHIEDTDTVLTIAKKMQEDYFDSLPYQHISLVDLYHALGSGAPIYNTNVHYARVTDHGLHKFSTLSFEYLRSIDPTEYDVTVHTLVSDSDIRISLSYWNTALSQERAKQVADRLSQTIRTMLDDIGKTVVSVSQDPRASEEPSISTVHYQLNQVDSVNVQSQANQCPLTANERLLRGIWVTLFNIDPRQLNTQSTFRGFGGDSFLAIKMLTAARKAGFVLTFSDALSDISFSDMAERLSLSPTPSSDPVPEFSQNKRFDFAKVLREKENIDFCTLVSNLELSSRFTPECVSLQATTDNFPLIKVSTGLTGRENANKSVGFNILDTEFIEDLLPVTSMQQAMLTSQARSEKFYNPRAVYKVTKSSVSPESAVFAAAWQQVVDSHSILRTIFVRTSEKYDSAYGQLVLKKADACVNYVHAADDVEAFHLLMSRSGVSCRTLMPAHALTICNTETGHLFFSMNISHALSDAVSLSILVGELLSRCNGHTTMTIQRSESYSRFVRYVTDHSSPVAEAYWTQYLSQARPCRLQTLEGVAGQLKSIPVHFERCSDLRRFTESVGMTASTIFRLAWGLILAHQTSMTDVCFGYVVSGRDAPLSGIDEVVGPVLNILPCRLQLARDTSLLQQLDYVQTDFLSSVPHQFWSSAHKNNALNPATAKFNTLVNFRNSGLSEPKTVSDTDIELLGSNDPMEYDLVLVINERRDHLDIELSYWEGCVPNENVVWIAEQLPLRISEILGS